MFEFFSGSLSHQMLQKPQPFLSSLRTRAPSAVQTLMLHLCMRFWKCAEFGSIPGILEHENFLSRPPRCVSVTGNKQHCLGQYCLHATDGREAGGGEIYKHTPGGRCRIYSISAQAEYLKRPISPRHSNVKEGRTFYLITFCVLT